MVVVVTKWSVLSWMYTGYYYLGRKEPFSPNMGPNSLADIKGLGSIKAALKIGNKKMKDDLDKASLHSSITY